jgi:hypothetical protein
MCVRAGEGGVFMKMEECTRKNLLLKTNAKGTTALKKWACPIQNLLTQKFYQNTLR